MDWNLTLRFLQDQGPVFWAACIAVSLGATLLAAAGFMHLRRRRPARKAADPQITVTATGYSAPAALAPAAPAPDPRLEELRSRLAAAAARLEAAGAGRVAAVSALKGAPRQVEYLHRSGRA
jgi:hypothetical protein